MHQGDLNFVKHSNAALHLGDQAQRHSKQPSSCEVWLISAGSSGTHPRMVLHRILEGALKWMGPLLGCVFMRLHAQAQGHSKQPHAHNGGLARISAGSLKTHPRMVLHRILEGALKWMGPLLGCVFMRLRRKRWYFIFCRTMPPEMQIASDLTITCTSAALAQQSATWAERLLLLAVACCTLSLCWAMALDWLAAAAAHSAASSGDCATSPAAAAAA